MKAIGFIGGGAMAEAIIKGLLGKGAQPERITVSDLSTQRLEYLENHLKVKIVRENKSVVQNSEVIIMAVKPQNLGEAVMSLAPQITADKLLISILAGIPTSRIEELLPDEIHVIRVMPNTPALVGCGTTVLAGGSRATEEDIHTASEIFQCVGNVSILPEKLMNAVTGLSGSGPAYVYMIIEALADGGVMAGLPRDVALRLAADTVYGSARMVQETQRHPGQLKDMVTSPGGTTIYGLHQLEKAGVRGSIMDAVLAATKRAGEL